MYAVLMTYEAILKKLQSQGKSYKEMRDITGASKGTISYWLGEGQVEKTRGRMITTRATIDAYVQHLKEASICVDCGHHYSYWNMQFDHLPQYVKSFNISDYRTHTQDLERVKAEIAKCDLVCANCHSDRSHYRRIEAKQLKALYNHMLKAGYGEPVYEVHIIVND